MNRRRFGSVRKLPSGRYQARYNDKAGRAHTAPMTFATKAEAGKWLSLVEADLERNAWRDPRLARVTVADWAEEWLGTKVDLKGKTRAGYESVLRTHIVPALGGAPVGTIDTPAVRRFLARVKAAGASNGTAEKVRVVLSMVMATAVEAGAIAANPVQGVRVGRSHRREMKFLTPAQIEDLAHAIANPSGHKGATFPEYATLVRFAAYTGLRAGELGALRVGRVDLIGAKVDVRESLAEVPGEGLVFGTTKTGKARTAPVPRFLVDDLARLCAGKGKGDLVFTAPEGGPLRHVNFYRRHFKPAVVEAGLDPGLRFHDLRHTCVALLVAQDAHPLAIMRRMGHSSIEMTLGTYGHLFPELEEALTDRLDEVGRAAQPTTPARVSKIR